MEYKLPFVKFVHLEIFLLCFASLHSILHIARSKGAWLERRFYDPRTVFDFHVAKESIEH